ncbi:multidrug resistance efflux transporter family protein [Lysobacter claricitrinus]|uniref:multidrug resistance efflux transporter family protein n=1 Tax=Lysobacter claricitrinus TaxID=3367728 RepID=UPI0037DBADC3
MKVAPRTAITAVGLALLSALFFTSTYVLNRAAAVDGEHWAWTAVLRYVWTVPLMLPLMRGRWTSLWRVMRAKPGPWFLWSGIGFVLFYIGLTYAASSGPAWLIAGTFQLTVIAGMLCAPLLYRDARRRVPMSALACGALAVVGVAMMQSAQVQGSLHREAWIASICVAFAAFAYPLGNRGLLLHLEREGIELDATQRVFGMTLASLPLWLPVAIYAAMHAGAPPLRQVMLSGGVALGAGVIATVLFFRATGMVRRDPVALGAAEAMQAAEILFAEAMGAMWLGEAWPHGIAAVGAIVVIASIALFSVLVALRPPQGP